MYVFFVPNCPYTILSVYPFVCASTWPTWYEGWPPRRRRLATAGWFMGTGDHPVPPSPAGRLHAYLIMPISSPADSTACKRDITRVS